MTDTSKTREVEQQVQDLELNQETIQDLTVEQAEAEKGGMATAKAPPMSLPSVYVQCL